MNVETATTVADTTTIGTAPASGFRRVSLIGLGYIGLPTAAMFASRGIATTGIDIRPEVVEAVRAGRVPIVEEGLDRLVAEGVRAGRLDARTEPVPADAFLLAVPTPICDVEPTEDFHQNRKPDLRFVEAAARSIAPVLEPGNLVILESTSPVGTTERVSRILAELRADLRFPHDHGEEADVLIAYCPERVIPGRTLIELVSNDRVIGGMSRRSAERAAELYRIFVQGECHLTDARTAEMVKLTENSFRDVNIAFANELSMVCDQLGIDVWNLIGLANRHPRVSILQPGPGVGGHCIAVDPWFIVDSAPKYARLIRTAREVNDSKPGYVLKQVRRAIVDLDRPTVAFLGLAFKPDVDDFRESPAAEVVTRFAKRHDGPVLVVEPHVTAPPEELAELGCELVSVEEALARADAFVLLVDHRAFRDLDASLISPRPLVDTRGLFRDVEAR